MTQPNYKAIVASAIARGLVRLPPPKVKFDPKEYHRTWVKEKRNRLRVSGLNWKGLPRNPRYKPRPELAGLRQRTPDERRAYKRAYMRLLRKGTIEL